MTHATTIARSVAHALKRDQDLDELCKRVWGRELRVILGSRSDQASRQHADIKNNQTPLVEITGSGIVTTGNEQDSDTVEIEMFVEVNYRDRARATGKEEDFSTPEIDDGVEVCKFAPELDELVEKIIAVARWNDHGAIAKQFSAPQDSVTDFPVCYCAIVGQYYADTATLDDINTLPPYARALLQTNGGH